MRIISVLCLCVLLCACGKKTRPTSPESNSNAPTGGPVTPVGGPVAGTPNGELKAPVLPARPALPKGWIEFKHPDGAYTVFLPARPKREQASSSLSRPVPAGGFLISTYEGYVPGLSFDVTATVCSPELVDSLRAADEQEMTGPDKKRSKVTWVGHPADEILVEDSKGIRTTYVRHLLIGNWAYVCRLQGDGIGRPTAEERTTIFDSFMPTPKR